MFYIFKDGKHEVYNVWNHAIGAWACDFDAGYSPREFGYTTKAYAYKRAIAIASAPFQPTPTPTPTPTLTTNNHFKTRTDAPNPPVILVLTRAELFEYIGVRDWAGER